MPPSTNENDPVEETTSSPSICLNGDQEDKVVYKQNCDDYVERYC